MDFFIDHLLVPGLAFVVLGAWWLRRRRHAIERPTGAATAGWAAGAAVCAGVTVGLVSGLQPSDGPAGNLVLLLAFGSGGLALHCVARLVHALMARAVVGDQPSLAQAARDRAQARQQATRRRTATPPKGGD